MGRYSQRSHGEATDPTAEQLTDYETRDFDTFDTDAVDWELLENGQDQQIPDTALWGLDDNNFYLASEALSYSAAQPGIMLSSFEDVTLASVEHSGTSFDAPRPTHVSSWQTAPLVLSSMLSAQSTNSYVGMRSSSKQESSNLPNLPANSQLPANLQLPVNLQSGVEIAGSTDSTSLDQSIPLPIPDHGHRSGYPESGTTILLVDNLSLRTEGQGPAAMKNAQGPLTLSTIVLPPKGKKRPHSKAKLDKARKVRSNGGACFRCKILKESCDDGTPCNTCLTKCPTLFTQPCVKIDFREIVPFRQGNTRYGMQQSQLPSYQWSSDDRTERQLHLVYPFEIDVPDDISELVINCRKFNIRNEVVMDPLKTKQGDVIVVQNPHFAWYDANDKSAAHRVESFLTTLIPHLLQEISGKMTDDLSKLVFEEARSFSQRAKDSALAEVLNIRAIAYFSKTRLVMNGPNVLDMDYFDNEELRKQGRMPLPGVIDYQVDTLCIQYMQEQMKMVSKRLTYILFRKPSFAAWYEVFLTCFIFLDCLEQLHNFQYTMLSRYENQDVSELHETYMSLTEFEKNSNFLAKASIVTRGIIEGWEHSAKTLIYVFRAILRGWIPFDGPWNQETRTFIRSKHPNMDQQAWSMIERLLAILEPRQNEIRTRSCEDINGRTANPLIWISRLFVDPDSNLCL